MFQFEGIYTPLITPYHDDYTVHWEALENHIESLITAGVHGIISGGSTGENYTQTVEERQKIAQFTCTCIKGRIPFIVGTGAMLTKDSVFLGESAKQMGADALLVGSPPYAVPTEKENALNALHIDRIANLPIMLYNYPGRMGVNMGEEFLDHVGKSRHFCAIKESSGDINRVHLLARDYPHIQLSCGMDDQALEFFAWGARSWVCGGSNFLPREHIALYRACVLDGNFEKGRRIMSAMLPFMRILEQGGKFIQNIKYGTTLFRHLHVGPVRPPLKDLNKDDKRILEQTIKVLQKTVADIVKEK